MLTYGIPPEFRGGVHMKPPYAIGSVSSLSGHAVAYRWRSLPRVRRHRASKPQGSSERVLPWQITMDQLIFASLSHTHYWYAVGMLKVPVELGDCMRHSRILHFGLFGYCTPKTFPCLEIMFCTISFPEVYCVGGKLCPATHHVEKAP